MKMTNISSISSNYDRFIGSFDMSNSTEEGLTRDTGHRDNTSAAGSAVGEEVWTLFGRRTQRTKVVYLCQIAILYIIIITCLVNITRESPNLNLWSTLLASSIGYLLPNPKIKADRKR